MKKISVSALALILGAAAVCFAQTGNLLVDDFEAPIAAGPEGTVESEAGNGSSVEVSGSDDIKYSGNKAMRIIFNAVPGGYIYVAKGDKLNARNAVTQVSLADINWNEYKAVSFYLHGSDSKANIAIDIKDKGNELWRYVIQDNFRGWRQVVCDFGAFTVRSDWQPDSAEKDAILAFPLTGFQFEPLPGSKGTIYIDRLELIRK